jgi:23S rRNA (cytosine1962-C5)-methyltransferase
MLSHGRKVLNVFAYTGAFSVAAWQGGATAVTTVDSSGPALAIAATNLTANGFTTKAIVEADAFTELRRLRDIGATFDLVILDPPKLVNNKQQVERGSRAYKDLNWLGLRLLNPGGILVTFSCSGSVSTELHQKIVADAAVDAGREAQIIGRLHQASDHPVLLSFPESQYLKGLVCRVS